MLGGTTVQVPPWNNNLSGLDDPASFCLSPNATNAVDDYSFFFQTDNLTAALQRYLPCNETSDVTDSDFVNVDVHSCDNFRMFEFKIRKCTRARSHDWTECPFAHPGEKARRRDPRKFHYSGTACPDFRTGVCRKGDACECAHGVFECWLHPARYRTQPCKDGMNCTRRICFFAHSPEQLRAVSPRADSFDGSPRRLTFMSSPESVSPTAESPPMSPSVNQLVASLRQLQLNKLKAVSNSWVVGGSSSSQSPRMNNILNQPGFYSLPNTPTRSVARRGIGYFDAWDNNNNNEEEPVMERVESGKDLRAKMFEKLSKENPLDRVNPDDVGWVSDLLE